MRKWTAVLAWLLALIALLTGCGGQSALSDGEQTATGEAEAAGTPDTAEAEEEADIIDDGRMRDEDFVEAVARALEARWDVSAAYTSETLAALSAAEYQDYLRRCVEAEESQLSSLTDYVFRDSDLGELAQTYYHALVLQRQGADYARTASLSEYNRTWILGYDYRVSVIYDLCRDFALRVDEPYEARLRELTAAYYDAKKQVAFYEWIEQLPASLQYTKDESNSSGESVCYSGVITNTTGYDIKSLSIEISFFNADGMILYQTSDWLSNLRDGQSALSTVYAGPDNYAGTEYMITIYQ